MDISSGSAQVADDVRGAGRPVLPQLEGHRRALDHIADFLSTLP